MINVETVNATARFGSATLDGSKFTGTKTFSFDSTIANGNAELTANTATTVTAGTNIAGLKVTNAAAGATVAVNGGAATSVTVNGAAGADVFTIATAAGTSALIIDGGAGTDAYTVNLKGGTLGLTGTNANNETLALNASTAAQTINATTGLAKVVTVAGDQSVTIKGAAAVFDTITTTNSLAAGKTLDVVVTSAAAAVDLSKIAASTISLEALNTSAKFAAGANVKLNTTDSGALNGTTSLNVDLLKATTGALTTDVATVNFTANTVAVTSLNATLGAATTINIAGTKDVTLASTYTAKAVSAAGLSGVLTATAIGEANRVNITGGSGNDKFTIGTVGAATTVVGGAGDDTVSIGGLTDFKLTLDGGAGTGDTLKATADTTFNGATATGSKTSVVTGFELVDIAGGATLTLTQKQLFTNGNDFTVSGTGTLAIVDDALSSTVFDLGNLKFTPGVTTVISIAGSTTLASTITGTASADDITGGAAADIINAGAGADTVTGGAGGDIINVGAGIDTILITATGQTFSGAAIVSGTTALTGIDKVTGMAAGDIISIAGIINTFTGAAGTTIAAASGNTVSLVRGNFADATNIFTADAVGTSTLFVYDADGSGAGTVLEAIILVGTAGVTGTAALGVLTLA